MRVTELGRRGRPRVRSLPEPPPDRPGELGLAGQLGLQPSGRTVCHTLSRSSTRSRHRPRRRAVAPLVTANCSPAVGRPAQLGAVGESVGRRLGRRQRHGGAVELGLQGRPLLRKRSRQGAGNPTPPARRRARPRRPGTLVREAHRPPSRSRGLVQSRPGDRALASRAAAAKPGQAAADHDDRRAVGGPLRPCRRELDSRSAVATVGRHGDALVSTRVQIAVTGSIAMDHLMTFPGRFAESLVAARSTTSRCRFLVDDLQIKRGGIAPNICFGLAALGLQPAARRLRSATTSASTAPGWIATAC